jgi:Tfp pilus assembly protein PilF
MLLENKSIVLILAATFLAYAGTLTFQFVSDDEFQIVNNPFIESWQNVPRFFTAHSWSHSDPNLQGNYYRPVALLWLLINHQLFGLNPSLWHLTTVLAHLAATLAVYALVNTVVKDRFIAGVAALIFGLHPLHIEAVAWVSGFTEPLLAVFFIASFLAYILANADQRVRHWGWLSLSLALYALALLTKETAIILPAFIAAYEWIFKPGSGDTDEHQEPERRTIERVPRLYASRAKNVPACAVPCIALAAAYLVTRAVVLKGLSHPLSKLSPSTLVFTWPSVLWFYVKHLGWPVGLSAFYDTPYVREPRFLNFILPAAAVASLAFGLWLALKLSTQDNRKVIGFALIWLALPILPLLNISVFREGEMVHDRYLYMPSVGLSIMLALVLSRLGSGRSKLFGRPTFQVVSVLALTGSLGFATAYQHIHWASNLSLYHHSSNIAPNNSVAANNLANELSRRGLYDDAIALYLKVLKRDPTHWAANYNLGCNYYLLGKHGEALQYLVRGVDLRPAEPKQYLTLAVTLEELHRPDEAERAIRQAIEIQPHGLGFHYELGDLLRAQGKLRAALDEYKAEIACNPGYKKAVEQTAEIEAPFARGDAGD